MKTSKPCRARNVFLYLLIVLNLGAAALAFRSANHPNVCVADTDTEQAAERKKVDESIWCPSAWSPETFFTCVLAVATCGLWVFTARLWQATERAVSDGQNAVTAALSHVQESARAATAMASLASTAENTAERQLRAYVEVTMRDGGIINITPGRHVEIVVWMMNSGQTPAYDVYVRSGIICAPLSDPEESLFSMFAIEDASRATLHSQRHLGHEISSRHTITSDDYSRLESEEWGMYVFGVVSYKDVFRKDRTTSFRLCTMEPGTGQKRLAFTRKGNDAD